MLSYPPDATGGTRAALVGEAKAGAESGPTGNTPPAAYDRAPGPEPRI